MSRSCQLIGYLIDWVKFNPAILAVYFTLMGSCYQTPCGVHMKTDWHATVWNMLALVEQQSTRTQNPQLVLVKPTDRIGRRGQRWQRLLGQEEIFIHVWVGHWTGMGFE